MNLGFILDLIALLIWEIVLESDFEMKIVSPSSNRKFCFSSFKSKVFNKLTSVDTLPPPLVKLLILVIFIDERSADLFIPSLCLIASIIVGKYKFAATPSGALSWDELTILSLPDIPKICNPVFSTSPSI